MNYNLCQLCSIGTFRSGNDNHISLWRHNRLAALGHNTWDVGVVCRKRIDALFRRRLPLDNMPHIMAFFSGTWV